MPIFLVILGSEPEMSITLQVIYLTTGHFHISEVCVLLCLDNDLHTNY